MFTLTGRRNGQIYNYIDSWSMANHFFPEKVDYRGLFPSRKGKYFVLTGINTDSKYKSAFPANSASAKTTIHELTECFIHHRSTLCSSASDERTHFTTNEVRNWTHIHRTHCSVFPTTLKQLAGQNSGTALTAR